MFNGKIKLCTNPENKVYPVAPILYHMWSCMFKARCLHLDMWSVLNSKATIAVIFAVLPNISPFQSNIFRNVRGKQNLDQFSPGVCCSFSALLSHMVHSDSCLNAAVYKTLMCHWNTSLNCFHSLCSSGNLRSLLSVL